MVAFLLKTIVKKTLPLVLVFILFTSFTPGVYSDINFDRAYPCIQYDKNKISEGTVKYLFSFFNKLDRFLDDRSGKVNIVHIGDSHIQADYLSSEARALFQETFGNGGRGFVFPFKVAQTNNPVNYDQNYSGRWDFCKATQSDDDCIYGINGITLNTTDIRARMSVFPVNNKRSDQSFNKVKFFYARDNESFLPVFTNDWDRSFYFDEQPVGEGFSEVFFNRPQDTLNLSFVKSFDDQKRFRLYGFSLENNEPGLLYHAIGLNGAFTKSFNKSPVFVNHLKALEPDLVIVSLGTNDNFLPESRFCPFCIKDNLRMLLDNIRESRPGVAILFCTPGDIFLRNGSHNSNCESIIKIIFELAEEYNCAVWNFNEIMGGNYSIKCWYRQELARSDYVHYTKKGYQLQGQLLYRAIMDAYERRFN
ncbi:MAG: hypothetical protein H6605_03190 [Flavobacteriales bacterium]|nr:hypothetical protein [Flavobacteriales bacterium]